MPQGLKGTNIFKPMKAQAAQLLAEEGKENVQGAAFQIHQPAALASCAAPGSHGQAMKR